MEQKYLIMHQSIPNTWSLYNTLGNKPFYSEFGVCILASQPFLLIKLNNNFKDILNRTLSNLKYFNENEGLCVSGDTEEWVATLQVTSLVTQREVCAWLVTCPCQSIKTSPTQYKTHTQDLCLNKKPKLPLLTPWATTAATMEAWALASEALGTWVVAMAVDVALETTDMALDMEAMATAIQFTMEDLDSPAPTEMFSWGTKILNIWTLLQPHAKTKLNKHIEKQVKQKTIYVLRMYIIL